MNAGPTSDTIGFNEKLQAEIQELLNFINAPRKGLQGSFYEGLITQLNILEQKDGSFFAYGKELGEKLANPDNSVKSIENYFEALKQFFVLHTKLVTEELRKVKKLAEQLKEELDEWDKRIDADDPKSEVAIAKKKITELQKKIEDTLHNDYQFELEREFLEQLKRSQQELFTIRTQFAEVRDENLVTLVRKDFVNEIKNFIKNKDLVWSEKIKKIKEELQVNNTLIEDIKINNTNVTEVYKQVLTDHAQFQDKLRENNATLVRLTSDFKKRITSRAQIITIFLFFLFVLGGEFSIIYTISIHALGFITNNTISYWFFVIGYPIAIGMAVKLWIQTSEDHKKVKKSLSKILIGCCLAGLLGLAYLNSNYQRQTGDNRGTQLDIEGDQVKSDNYGKDILLLIPQIVVFFSFSTLFGGGAGLLFVVFFDKYEDYTNVKKGFFFTNPSKPWWPFANYQRIINDEITALMDNIKELHRRRDDVKAQLRRTEVYSDMAVSDTINYSDWVEKLKQSARSNFLAGYEAGKAQRINSRDESDIILTDIKTKGVNKIINSFKTESNGHGA